MPVWNQKGEKLIAGTHSGVEVYGLRVKDLAEGMGMNPGSVSRVLARASQREREDRTFHEQRLELEARLAELEDSRTRSRR